MDKEREEPKDKNGIAIRPVTKNGYWRTSKEGGWEWYEPPPDPRLTAEPSKLDM